MFKKIMAFLLAVVLALGLIPAKVLATDVIAEGVCGENLTWVIESNGVLTISGNGPMYDYNWGMSEISDLAPWFENDNNDRFTSVIIEHGVTSIGCNAFNSDTTIMQGNKITNVTIPATVTSIRNMAFANCHNLTRVVIPDSVITIERNAFSASGLEEVIIGNGVTSIGNNAFSSCGKLKKVTIGNQVASLGDGVFYECDSLSEITIPGNVKTIGDRAFYKCTSLSSAIIESGVNQIGEAAFFGCSSLTAIGIPESVWSIGDEAFYYCTNLRAVSIPKRNTYCVIGEKAFCCCVNLYNINIGYGVTEIKDRAFGDCHSLTSISIPDSVKIMGKSVFDYCPLLMDIDLSANAATIEEYTFDRCDSLASITLPEGITDIDAYAFYNCNKLTSLVVPESMLRIYDKAFTGCWNLKDIYYCGTESQWAEVMVWDKSNLANVNIHYEYNPCPYTDVSRGSYYYYPVVWAMIKDITAGTSETTFNPNGQCQRAQVVTFLWRAAGCPKPVSTDNPFTDVKETDFYYEAVLWAVENGITNGLDATHFGPFAYCNRAQVVTFLYRAMEQPDVSVTECPFTDVEDGAWYETPVLWAVENGVTNGMDATNFGVNIICNRAQVVAFLYRTYVN